MIEGELPVEQMARRYGAACLQALGLPISGVSLVDEHPADRAAACGLTALTGPADGPPLTSIAPLAAAADGVLAALWSLVPDADRSGLTGAGLLTERAADFGHGRRGCISAGGSCRLLAAADGRMALNLARPEDRELLSAWLQAEIVPDDWTAIARHVAAGRRDDWIGRGREMGLAVAADVMLPAAPWLQTEVLRPSAPVPQRLPRVLDLSALWAGPLCGHLLQRCGADVVKLESTVRPDGARRGPPAFFDRLNAGKRMAAVDFDSADGRARLKALVAAADIVIEAARPRALRQLGIDAEAWVAVRPGRTWISLTAHGRQPPADQWIGFGDDAGVAGGLSALLYETTGQSAFVGDAIADPLAGLHAALAAWAGWRQGGGCLLSLSLSGVVRHVLHHELPATVTARRRRLADWAARQPASPAVPPARPLNGRAAPLGVHTAAVCADWGVAC